MPLCGLIFVPGYIHPDHDPLARYTSSRQIKIPGADGELHGCKQWYMSVNALLSSYFSIIAALETIKDLSEPDVNGLYSVFTFILTLF